MANVPPLSAQSYLDEDSPEVQAVVQAVAGGYFGDSEDPVRAFSQGSLPLLRIAPYVVAAVGLALLLIGLLVLSAMLINTFAPESWRWLSDDEVSSRWRALGTYLGGIGTASAVYGGMLLQNLIRGRRD